MSDKLVCYFSMSGNRKKKKALQTNKNLWQLCQQTVMCCVAEITGLVC